MRPHLNEEKKLWKKGYDFVIGLDEVGRGPLAGPVFACAVYIKKNHKSAGRKADFPEGCIINHKYLRDSKKLTAKQREEIFQALKEADGINWGIARVSEKVIDKINILEATKLAMKKAINRLREKIQKNIKNNPCQNSHDRGNFDMGCFLIIDGNFGIKSSYPQKSIIKADERIASCVLAGIIAKVARDKMMLNYHKKYPQYGFDRHKGYPTKLHKEMLNKYGFSKIHRKTFKT